MSKLQQCTVVLQEFVGGARFEESIVRSNDNAYTRISIVMPSYNQVNFIERSILSVLNQSYPNLQFIIMDGGSTDGTLDVIRKYEKHLCWRSEPDRGQSDALNKALMLADGELVGWLNSDDVYFPGVFYRMHELSRQTPEAVLYTGSVARIDADDRLIRVPRHVPPSVRSLLFSFPMQSQGVFWRREVQSRAGVYNTDLHYAMDFDFWLKVLSHGSAEFIPELVGGFRTYQGTKTSSGWDRGQAELRAIRKQYGTDDATARWRFRRNIMVLSDLFQRIFVIRRHCVTIATSK